MKVIRFDPVADLIVIHGVVWGPRGEPAKLRLALDTGSSETMVDPEILDGLGYSARQGEAITKIRSAIGEEPGYMLRVARFRALGFDFTDFRVHAHDLAEGWGINGLLGLNFLKQFNYEIRSGEGRILAERLSQAP